MNGVAHKKPISGSAASGTSDYRVRLQFVGKIWERVCGKECRDLSTFHYSREAYGPRIDLLPRPSTLPRSRFFSSFYLSLCDTWPERKKPSAISPSYQKAKWLGWKSVLVSYKSLNGSLKRSVSSIKFIRHNEMQKRENNVFNNCLCATDVQILFFNFLCFYFHESLPRIVRKRRKFFSLFTRRKNLPIVIFPP